MAFKKTALNVIIHIDGKQFGFFQNIGKEIQKAGIMRGIAGIIAYNVREQAKKNIYISKYPHYWLTLYRQHHLVKRGFTKRNIIMKNKKTTNTGAVFWVGVKNKSTEGRGAKIIAGFIEDGYVNGAHPFMQKSYNQGVKIGTNKANNYLKKKLKKL